jgi:hypothetical protein
MRIGTVGISWIRFNRRWRISRSANFNRTFKEKKSQVEVYIFGTPGLNPIPHTTLRTDIFIVFLSYSRHSTCYWYLLYPLQFIFINHRATGRSIFQLLKALLQINNKRLGNIVLHGVSYFDYIRGITSSWCLQWKCVGEYLDLWMIKLNRLERITHCQLHHFCLHLLRAIKSIRVRCVEKWWNALDWM